MHCHIERKIPGIHQSMGIQMAELQWLLIDKSTPIGDQESPDVGKSMLCSNPDLLRPNALPKFLSIIISYYYALQHCNLI